MAILQRGCCCTVRTCSQVIAWFSTIGGFIGLIMCIILVGANWILETMFENMAETNEVDMGDFNSFWKKFTAFGYVLLVITILIVSSAIMMLCGTCHNNPNLVLPFIVVMCLQIVIMFAYYIMMGFLFGWTTYGIIMTVVGICVQLLFGIYFLLVVISHYQNLRDGIIEGGQTTVVVHHTTGTDQTHIQQSPGMQVQVPAGYAPPYAPQSQYGGQPPMYPPVDKKY